MVKKILRRYGRPSAAIVGLYALNRFWLTAHTTGLLHRLLAWHFADFLAGGLMLCLLNTALALALAGRRPVERLAPALAFSLICGLFWEVITPLYLPRSVGDWRDILAVGLGGLVMWRILHRRKRGCSGACFVMILLPLFTKL